MLECFTDTQTLLQWNRSNTHDALGEAVERGVKVKTKWISALALGIGTVIGSIAGNTEFGVTCANLILSLFI